MSIDIQKAKTEAHENAAKHVATMLQVSVADCPGKCSYFPKLFYVLFAFYCNMFKKIIP